MSAGRQVDNLNRNRNWKVPKPSWNNETYLRIQHGCTSETISFMQLYTQSKKRDFQGDVWIYLKEILSSYWL